MAQILIMIVVIDKQRSKIINIALTNPVLSHENQILPYHFHRIVNFPEFERSEWKIIWFGCCIPEELQKESIHIQSFQHTEDFNL